MRHLNDTELVRYADGERPEAGEAWWEEHVASCQACGDAVGQIRSNSRLVSHWLEHAGFEADLGAPADSLAELVASRSGEAAGEATRTRPEGQPVARLADRRRAKRTGTRSVPTPGSATGTWLKAAVIVLLVAAPLAAFPGVRAWVGQQLGGEPGIETPQAADPAEDMMVMFAPEPGLFTVQITSPPEDGTLTLRRSDFETATLRTDGSAEPVVSARSLRIAGGAPGTAYELELPAVVTSVEITVGDLAIRVTGEEIDAGRTVELR